MSGYTQNIIFFNLIGLLLACSAPTSVVEPTDILHDEVSIGEIHQGYTEGTLSVSDVVDFYLKRIEDIDRSGPGLTSVITVNPQSRQLAGRMDSILAQSGITGPLFGIPVLVKDNVNTGDGMPCTAGARVMATSVPEEDSPLVRQLREAGALILGKTNLSEWANFHSYTSSSGWSGLGGQTKNPYKLDHNPCGSSAGSGVAVAANLCVVAIGSETNGSIICPSNNNGIVGIKPTVGLISRTGIIPISKTQDTGGPMARSVTDAAIALGTMTGRDPKDETTMEEGRTAYGDYTTFLEVGALKGKRIGYYTKPLEQDSTELSGIMQRTLDTFRALGAEIIIVDEILHPRTGINSFIAMQYQFKEGINAYLADMGKKAPVSSLAEVVDSTFKDSVEMKFDHQLLRACLEKGNLVEEEYRVALDSASLLSRSLGMDRIMDSLDLDAIIAPSGSPAWKTDHEKGDQFGVYSSSPAAIAGYPNITVPMGQINGLPVGVSIFGRPWTEGLLLGFAYDFEQATKYRFTPQFKP
jgi:amidase